MQKYLKKILSLGLISAMSISLLVLETANALAPTGTMTSTALSLTAGTTAAINTITVTSGGTEVTAVSNIKIKIPASVNATWDTTDTSVTTVQSATGVINGTVTYGDSNKTLILDVTTNFASGENVQISGLSLVPTATSTAAALTWSVDDGANYGTGNANTNVTVSPADSAASAVKTNPIVGSTGDLALTFTTPRALVVGESVLLNFASTSYTAASTTGSIAAGGITNNGNSSTFNVTTGGPNLILTVATATLVTGAHIVTIPGVDAIPYYASATNLSSVVVATDSGGSVTIAVDASVDLTDTVAADAAAGVQLLSPAVGATGNTTLTITAPFALDQADTIDITFPAHIDVSGVASAVTGTLEATDTITCTAAAQVVTCITTGATNATGTIIMTGITSSFVATTNITSVEIEDEGVAANDIATDTVVDLTDTTAAAIVTANVEPQSLIATAAPVNIISFTTINTIPNLGKIVVTYPTGYGVAGANGRTAFTLSGLDGTWTAAVSGQVITLTQTGGGASAIGAKSLRLEGITNPSQTGATSTYTITTTNSADGVRDTITTVAADSIISGSSSSSSSSSSTATTTTATTTTTTTATDSTATTTTDTEADTAIEEPESEEEPSEASGEVTTTTEAGVLVTITDIANHWANKQITALIKEGVVKGNPDGSFKPDNSLNRAEAAAFLFRVLGFDEEELSAPEEKPFSDVAVDSWYAVYIDALKGIEVVKGNPDGSYAPGKNINRAEFLTLAMNAYYYTMAEDMGDVTTTDAFSDLEKDAWYAKTVSKAFELKFINGSACGEKKCFNANSSITRAEATVMLYNIFYKEISIDDVPTEVESE